jgi:stearoyl-CoA 9-desaturase NADPH oxidoreductase
MFTETSLGRTVGALVDALTAPHGRQSYLDALAPSLSSSLRAEVLEVRRPTAATVTMRLRPGRAFAGFRAGQHVPVAVEIDGVRHTRYYSPAGPARARNTTLELSVRAHPGGLVSNYLYEHARPGMMLGLGQAAGDFVLATPRPARLLLLSGGSGVTPVMAMLRTLIDEGHTGHVTFVHYTRHEHEHPYRADLVELARAHPWLRVHTIATRAQAKASRGHLTAAQLHSIDARWREAQLYVCGPPGLHAAASTLCARAGEPQQLHSESFLPPRPSRRSGGNGRVCFADSAVEVRSSGVSLLEQAERAGLSPAYGCRMGICHTCTTRKLSGRVQDLRSGQLSSAEPEDVQLCVSVPVGDVELAL